MHDTPAAVKQLDTSKRPVADCNLESALGTLMAHEMVFSNDLLVAEQVYGVHPAVEPAASVLEKAPVQSSCSSMVEICSSLSFSRDHCPACCSSSHLDSHLLQ